jgi:hypothetical protein
MHVFAYELQEAFEEGFRIDLNMPATALFTHYECGLVKADESPSSGLKTLPEAIEVFIEVDPKESEEILTTLRGMSDSPRRRGPKPKVKV